MKNKNLQIKLIPEIEKQFKIKVADIKTPPQGMDSEVFFIMDSNGKEYAIKHGKNAANDILSYKLLEENKVNIPVPKLFGNFTFENEMVVILEKINFSLLEANPVYEMYTYIPSMVEILKKSIK